MAGLRTTADLLADALEKAGEKSDGTSEYQSFALVQMNQRYKQILSGATVFEVNLGQPWPWAKARFPKVLTLEPPYATGTVGLTLDSVAGLFSTAPTTSLAGRLLKLTDRPDYIRIDTHTAGAPNFVIDAPYSETTITGSAFAAHQLEYDIGVAGGSIEGILRLFAPFRVYKTQGISLEGQGLINQLSQPLMEYEYPLNQLKDGTPTQFCQSYNSDGLIVVRFNKSVSERTRLEYDYIPVPAELVATAASIPVILEAYRDVLSLATAHDILADKEDDKAQVFFSFTKAQLQAMASSQGKERQNTRANYGRIIARPDQTQRRRFWHTQD